MTSDVGSVAAPVPDTGERDDGESDRTSDNATVLKAATVRGGMDVAKSQPVSPEEVQTNYEEKGATVLVFRPMMMRLQSDISLNRCKSDPSGS